MTAIRAIGAYTPRFGIDSETIGDVWDGHAAANIDRLAVPDGDEDALTMGWEAATRALEAAGCAPTDVAALTFATTTPPIDEEDLVVRLGSMLGVPGNAHHSTQVGSSRVGTDALCTRLAAGPWDAGVGLVVVADAPAGQPDDEHGQGAGAGAGAIVLDAEGPGEVIATGHGARAAPGGRFRERTEVASTGLGVTTYDRDTFRSTVLEAVENLDVGLDDVEAVAMHSRDGKRPYRLAGDLGVDPEVIHRGTSVHAVGYTAAAGVLLGLGRAIEAGASRVLVVGYGAGAGADAILLAVDGVETALAIEPDIDLEYGAYLRRIGELDGDAPDGGGAYVSLPTWRRALPQRHRLEAGRCVACEALAFPPDGACDDCGASDGYTAVALSGAGTVETVTTIAGGAPPEFDTYQTRVGSFQTAIVAFDAPDGDRVSAPAMVTTDRSVAVGDRVRAVVRRLYTQEGLPRYGRKVRAIEG